MLLGTPSTMRPPPPPHPSDTSPRYPHHKAVNNNQHQPTELSNNVLPNVPENDDVAQYRSLTLELTCTRTNNSKENVDVDTVRKVEASDGSIRFIATMPSSTVDGEQANLTAALLFEQIDQLAVGSTSHTYQVERVKITALQFTKEAIVGIQGFLSMFIETIKHVSMKDIVAEECTPMEEQAFLDLCMIFEPCPLETLNLSDNLISAPIWKCWSKQSHLRQLILDFVEIPDDSLCVMAQNFTYGDTLEELYVVLTNHIGPAGVIAANNVLKECRNVGSLRWAVKDAPPDVLMPWRGLANLAQEMSKASKASTLLHLVMDGGTITEEDCGLMGIGGALEYFTQLKTIKFRSIGLKDIGALHIANALCVSQPPLEILDLSRNYIQYNGASSIAAVSEVHNIATNLNYLSLERNNIDANGAIKVLSAFGAKGSQKLDVKLDGNPFNFSKVAYALAWQKGRIEHSHDDSLNDNRNSGHTNNSDRNTNDVKVLQDEVLRLQDEKAILMQAFSVVGSANHVAEHIRMLDRISTLETKIFGQSQDTIVPDHSTSNHLAEDIDTSLRHRTTFSDHSSRAEPPMTPTGSNNRIMMNSNQSQLVNHTNPLRSPISVYNNNKIKPSNTVHANGGNEYWSASPAGSCYSANSNQKKKVGISGSISETPNMYQNSPNLGGFIKNSSIRSGGSGPEYDDNKKSGRSTSSSVSNSSRNPSPFPRR